MPEITIFRVRSEQIGYGRLGVYLAEEIEKQGITVYDEIAEAGHNFVLDSPEAYKAFGPKAPQAGCSEIVLWVSVPSHARGWYSGQKAVMFTMWETRHLPSSFRENFHEFDTIIVPSEQNKELFSPYHPNVHYVPLGIDTDRWHYVPRTMPTTRFNFLVSGRGLRKGTDLAYKAFREVFPSNSWPSDMPTPYLIMKSPRPEDYYGDRIESVTGYLPSEAEVDLYAQAHCYLGASRGEGFGLQPLQAIAQGLPTILTDAHGHKAFSHLGMPLDTEIEKAGYFVFGDAGAWWEPDYKQLCEYMEYVYYNYQDCVDRAEVNAIDAAKFTWKNTADGVLDAIGRDRLNPCKDPGHWFEPTGKLFKIVLVRDHVFDIGGYVRKLEKGVEYRVPADTKRILFDAGLVDVAASRSGDGPIWDDGDEGLLPEQVARMPQLTERQSYCPTCHQKYGSGTTLTDKILSEPELWTR